MNKPTIDIDDRAVQAAAPNPVWPARSDPGEHPAIASIPTPASSCDVVAERLRLAPLARPSAPVVTEGWNGSELAHPPALSFSSSMCIFRSKYT